MLSGADSNRNIPGNRFVPVSNQHRQTESIVSNHRPKSPEKDSQSYHFATKETSVLPFMARIRCLLVKEVGVRVARLLWKHNFRMRKSWQFTVGDLVVLVCKTAGNLS